MVTSPPRLTIPTPWVVNDTAWMVDPKVFVPVVLKIRSPKPSAATEPPIAPCIRMLPEPAAIVRLFFSSADEESAALKLTAPLFEVNVTLSVSVIACAKLIALPVPVTEILPPRLLAPAPAWLNAPVELIVPAAMVVRTPEFTIVTVPPDVTAALTVKPVPVNDSAPVNEVAPLMVVSPVPALCVRLAAVKAAPRVTSFAETSVTAPKAPVSEPV